MISTMEQCSPWRAEYWCNAWPRVACGLGLAWISQQRERAYAMDIPPFVSMAQVFVTLNTKSLIVASLVLLTWDILVVMAARSARAYNSPTLRGGFVVALFFPSVVICVAIFILTIPLWSGVKDLVSVFRCRAIVFKTLIGSFRS